MVMKVPLMAHMVFWLMLFTHFLLEVIMLGSYILTMMKTGLSMVRALTLSQ